jgi:tetratricopeptide (TPR) repeat protein
MNYIKLLIILGAFTAQVACKGPKTAVSSPEQTSNSRKKELSERDRLTYEYAFHNANKEKIIGNYEQAAALYAQCIKMDNSRPTPFYELAGIYALIGKNDYALEFAKIAAELDPSNNWFNLQYAELLKRNGHFQKSVSVYERLVKNNPSNIDFYFEWANSLLHIGKTSEALAAYEKIESIMGINEEISMQKQRIFLKQGHTDKAIAEAKRLIKSNPSEARYYGMLAELYLSKKMDEKAIEVFNQVLDFEPENPFVNLSLADYYNQKNEHKKSFTYLEKAFANPDLEIDTKIKILISFYIATERNTEFKQDAFSLADKLILAHPQDAKSYAIYGDFLVRDQRYEEARNNFRKAVELDTDRFMVWNQLLMLESELGDFHSMALESNKAIELFPTQPVFYLFNGIANTQKREYDKAIEMLEMGLALVVDNPQLKGQFYSSLGDVYYKISNHPKSDKNYEKALEIDPENVFVLNNYAYYLSLRKENLERAEAMSKKSNELSPNNSSFLDTYGWILYVQGKYEESKKYLFKAIENGGENSGVILEHFGDVLYKLNDSKNALTYWERAKSAGGGTDLLERKIKEKKLIE